ncbi:TonB-dependent receptor [Sphingobium sp. BHU LFT2]|uniref:TonB-dependent receptor n=1 Tax=Sphingobium sp. BHU LFT2 TaxID=2807634 RepID=UPI001BEA16EA|nr:TonB-dependent receptor [Sphingobium sp. BHU LFT2]MBT2245951.1 TonB-dependent receptor [Sphingobium sp. BHU LFT2]
MKRFKLHTALGLFLTGTGAPVVAIAQTSVTDAGSATASSLSEDIIVTAQKDRQTLQRTPAAITAIQSTEIVTRGITDLVSVQNFVPSARIQAQGASVEVYIRGIGTTNDFANTEPPVAFAINGVYVPREAMSTPFFDIDQIEILPGPQGTLYGRSAIGGIVNVTLKRPTHEWETQAIGEVGNYGLFHGTLVQNIPVSDNFALRAGVDYTNRNGYQKSGASAADDLAGRLSALYTPTENFSAYVWGFLTRKRGTATNLVNKGFNPVTGQVDGKSFLHNDPWDDTLTGPLLEPYTALFGPVKSFPVDYDGLSVGAQFDLTLGDVTISAIPAYTSVDSKINYFLGSLFAVYNAKIKAYSNELRASGDSGRMKWQAGVNVYRQVNSDVTGIPPIFINYNYRNRSKGVGIYAQATYSITDEFRITGGGRYSSDSRTGRGVTAQAAFDYSSNAPWTADVKSNHLDWKVGLEYDATDKVLLYATVQSGYQPATYNSTPDTDSFDNRVDSSTIIAYTAGFKSRMFDNKLTLNSEFFYYDYKNLPLQGYDPDLLFNPIFNSQKVEIYGNQTDIIFRPTRNDNLSASIGYLHARQTEAIVPSSPFFGKAAGLDVSGLQMMNAPTWTITASYSHDFQLSRGYVRAFVGTRYESDFYGSYTHGIGSRQKAYFMSDANLTYHDEQGGWSLGAWIKNIENEAVQSALGLGGTPGPAITFLQAPRTYGLRATFDF